MIVVHMELREVKLKGGELNLGKFLERVVFKNIFLYFPLVDVIADLHILLAHVSSSKGVYL